VTAAPFHLTVANIIEAGRKAFDEERLQAQNGVGACTYRDPFTKLPCVVGAAIPDEVFAIIDKRGHNASAISTLLTMEDDPILTCDPAELQLICNLQNTHDEATDAAGQVRPKILEELRQVLHGELDPAEIFKD
jgi:hypothetical protein